MIPKHQPDRSVTRQTVEPQPYSHKQTHAIRVLSTLLEGAASDLAGAAKTGDATEIAEILAEVRNSLNPADLRSLSVTQIQEFQSALTGVLRRCMDVWFTALAGQLRTGAADASGMSDIIDELRSLSAAWMKVAESDYFHPEPLLSAEFSIAMGQGLGDLRHQAEATGHPITLPVFQAPPAPTANATFSATLIPSTPADKMPPA